MSAGTGFNQGGGISSVQAGTNISIDNTDPSNPVISSTADDITVVTNYSALPPANTVSGKFYWCSEAQGTWWLPGGLGGTYYNKGVYYSNGTEWEYIETPYQATQAEVNTGTNDDKFVTPLTLNSWSALETCSTFDELLSNVFTMQPQTGGTTVVGWHARIYFYPLLVRRKTTLTEIALAVVQGATGGEVRLAIYNSLNGLPNSLLYETGVLNSTSAGIKSELITPNLVLQPGLYYRAMQSSLSGIGIRGGSGVQWIPNPTVTQGFNNTNFQQDYPTFQAFPATATPIFSSPGNTLHIYIKAL